MGLIGMTAAIMHRILKGPEKYLVCSCPNCKKVLHKHQPGAAEKSVDLPPLIFCPKCGKRVCDPYAVEIALLSPENAYRAAAKGYAGTWSMELHKDNYALSRLKKSLERLSSDDKYLMEILSLQGLSPDCYYAVFNSQRLHFNARSGGNTPETLTEEQYLRRFSMAEREQGYKYPDS